jgi:AcrR family transcriptional regulator
MVRSSAQNVAPRRRGRPRSESADAAIYTAAIEIVAEVGYRVATLEAIAARAGVGTATVYRRYRTKRELVAAALRVEAQRFTAPRTGDIVEDLAVLMQRLSTGVQSTPLGRLLAAMAFAEPELFDVGWHALAQPRRKVLRELVVSALEAGQLRPDLDVELFLDIVSALPIWTQLMRPGADFTLDTAHAAARLLLAGARP